MELLKSPPSGLLVLNGTRHVFLSILTLPIYKLFAVF